MKQLLIGTLLIFSVSALAANREQARQITDQLNLYAVPSDSNDPDKALLYKSQRGNVDNTQVEVGLSITRTPTTLSFTRADGLALTRCTADYGVATVTPTEIQVVTTQAPIRVLCSTVDGEYRAFYTTYKQQ